MFSPERYVDALRFAAAAHREQRVPGTELPYLVHVVSVAAEVIAVLPVMQLAEPDLAVTCALLHDSVEDTSATIEVIAGRFGAAVAAGVGALTKDTRLPKAERMADSLRRIREQPREIAIVKLADRITNLAPPPTGWTRDKCAQYRLEAISICDAIGDASDVLADRLRVRVAAYAAYC